MENTSIASLMMIWQGKVPQESQLLLQEKLKEIPEDKMPVLSSIQMKNPVVGLVLGLFLGGFGADRFYKGNFFLGGLKIVLGILYLICFLATAGIATHGDENPVGAVIGVGLFGGLGTFFGIVLMVWCFIDLFLVWKGIKKDNFNKIQNTLLIL